VDDLLYFYGFSTVANFSGKKSTKACKHAPNPGTVFFRAAEAAPSAVYNPGAGPLVPAPSTGGRAGELRP
jgi:hypothetical protein